MPPKISVIIPTFNRLPILSETVTALASNVGDGIPAWELIIVDDGSTDQTPTFLELLQSENRFNLVVIRQANKKQATARNKAMQVARGRLFVFLGDDTVPVQDFLAIHWQRFQEKGEPANYAAIGHVDWHDDIARTPFRNWINNWGPQFGFRLIENPDHVPFNFFYTSNLAFSRALYDGYGGFNEIFSQYGWEDIELGLRYQKKGHMRLRYEPKALVRHLHHISIESFCQRQIKVGYSAVKFYRLYPELREFLFYDEQQVNPRMKFPLLLFGRLLGFFDEYTAIEYAPLCQRFLRLNEWLLNQCYRLGMWQAQQEGNG